LVGRSVTEERINFAKAILLVSRDAFTQKINIANVAMMSVPVALRGCSIDFAGQKESGEASRWRLKPGATRLRSRVHFHGLRDLGIVKKKNAEKDPGVVHQSNSALGLAFTS